MHELPQLTPSERDEIISLYSFAQWSDKNLAKKSERLVTTIKSVVYSEWGADR